MKNSLSPLAKEILGAGQYWLDSTPPYWYIVNISTMILVLSSIDNMEKEAELKEIQIIKEAENSNDPVLKQKAANMKAEIAREEQNKLQSWISEEQSQELAKNLGIEKNTFEMLIFAGVAVIFISSACLAFKLIF